VWVNAQLGAEMQRWLLGCCFDCFASRLQLLQLLLQQLLWRAAPIFLTFLVQLQLLAVAAAAAALLPSALFP
jgi:hypothetical protein